MARPINDSKSVVLNGSGVGEVEFGPGRPNTSMVITGVSVNAANFLTATNVPTARVYRGSSQPSNFVSGTFSGNMDSDNELNIVLNPGDVVTVRWTGGDAGASHTATFRGLEYVGGQ